MEGTTPSSADQQGPVLIKLSTRSTNTNAAPAAAKPIVSQSETAEVDAGSVIRVILQYLKEANFTATFQSLQEESGVYLRALENPEAFSLDIQGGNLSRLLEVCGQCSLPQATLFDVLEHVALELLEAGDKGAFDTFIKSSKIFETMSKVNVPKYKRLINLRNREGRLNKADLWGETSKLRKRKAIAKAVLDETETAPPGRLLSLLAQALRAQRASGLISNVGRFDLMKNMVVSDSSRALDPPNSLRHIISLKSKQASVFCCAFSPDGQSLITGDSEGELNVWAWTSGQLRLDLDYQRDDYVMSHADQDDQPLAVTAVAISFDGQVLASGDKNGNIKIWQIASGKLARQIDRAHNGAVTSIRFHPTEPQLLTTSTDETAKILLLRNAAVGRVLSGHEGFVKSALFDTAKGRAVLTASDDGMLRTFAVKTGECVSKFSPPKMGSENQLARIPIELIVPDNRAEKRFFVCPRGPQLHCMDTNGNLIKTYAPEVKQPFKSIATSPKSEWLLGLSLDGDVFAMNSESGEVVTQIPAPVGSGGGMTYHPTLNVVAVWGSDNRIAVLEG